MDTFPFSYHSVTHSYPRGDGQKFGRGYSFAAAPQLPLVRTFKLQFSAMQWDAPDTKYDMQTFINFYEVHNTFQPFIYPHPKFGNITVRFSADTPLEVPRSHNGGTGVTEGFEISLVEQPV